MTYDQEKSPLAAVTIIDRRLSGKNKSIGNRERFLERYKTQIRRAVDKAIGKKDIKDIHIDNEVHIPRRDMGEPVFEHAKSGGKRWSVHPGNDETKHSTGDHIARPQGGSGRGSGASNSGEGEDDFMFTLSKEEFWNIFFEDMALPNIARTQLAATPEWKYARAGFTSTGSPNNLSVVRTFRNSLGRGVAFGKLSHEREIDELEQELLALEPLSYSDPDLYEVECVRIEDEIARLRNKINVIPYIDTIDLKYRSSVRVPKPIFKAVMFCVMDVSGSMDEERKDLSKRFFVLLYLFLTRHYEKIELVFIRHHTVADEVDQETFFHGTEMGGTVVSSGLLKMKEIIDARYPSSEWNIYGAQASDGDNYQNDNALTQEVLAEQILPLVRYFAYIQVVDEEQGLWDVYSEVAASFQNFAMEKVTKRDEVYPVLHDLFKKEG